MAAAVASLYKGQEKEINVREEHWFPRYYAVNADTLNNVARKNPTARIKMVGIQGDLKFGVRTKLEWTALQEDIQAQVLEGTITKRPEWLQVAFEDIKTELDWVDEGDGNRVLILCSCPARIGDDHKIMEQVDAMCQGNLKVEITFSKAGNAASNMFESGAVLGGGGAAQRQEYSDKLVAWFSALHISEAKTNEALHYLCGDEVGVVEVEDLALVDDASLEHAANILPPVRKVKFQKAIAVLKEGKTGKQPAPPPSLKPSCATEEDLAGSSGGGGGGRRLSDKLTALLVQEGLETACAALLFDAGVETLEDLQSMSMEELKSDVKLKHMHAKKLEAAAKAAAAEAKAEARAAARAALDEEEQSNLDKAVYDECNDRSKGNRGKVEGMLDRGADPNGYKVRRT